jgi:hypothetical protein
MTTHGVPLQGSWAVGALRPDDAPEPNGPSVELLRLGAREPAVGTVLLPDRATEGHEAPVRVGHRGKSSARGAEMRRAIPVRLSDGRLSHRRTYGPVVEGSRDTTGGDALRSRAGRRTDLAEPRADVVEQFVGSHPSAVRLCLRHRCITT